MQTPLRCSFVRTPRDSCEQPIHIDANAARDPRTSCGALGAQISEDPEDACEQQDYMILYGMILYDMISYIIGRGGPSNHINKKQNEKQTS